MAGGGGGGGTFRNGQNIHLFVSCFFKGTKEITEICTRKVFFFRGERGKEVGGLFVCYD